MSLEYPKFAVAIARNGHERPQAYFYIPQHQKPEIGRFRGPEEKHTRKD